MFDSTDQDKANTFPIVTRSLTHVMHSREGLDYMVAG